MLFIRTDRVTYLRRRHLLIEYNSLYTSLLIASSGLKDSARSFSKGLLLSTQLLLPNASNVEAACTRLLFRNKGLGLHALGIVAMRAC